MEEGTGTVVFQNDGGSPVKVDKTEEKMLNINKIIENGKAAFSLEGRLDTVTSPSLEAELNGALDGVSELTMDFEKLEYTSSAGLRVPRAAQKEMNKRGVMKLTHVGGTIMEIFEVTGFSDILTIE